MAGQDFRVGDSKQDNLPLEQGRKEDFLDCSISNKPIDIDKSINQLNLKPRTLEVLSNHFKRDITIRELVDMSETDLLDGGRGKGVSSFGEVALSDVVAKLQEHNLRLRLDW